MESTLTDNSTSSSSIVDFKIYSGIIIWCLAIIGGLLPLYSSRLHRGITSVLQMLSGGIFFASSTMHLLPDAAGNERLQCLLCTPSEFEYFKLHGKPSSDPSAAEMFPWPYFFYGMGFLMILLLETFAHEVHHMCLPEEDDHDHHYHFEEATSGHNEVSNSHSFRKGSSTMTEHTPLVLNSSRRRAGSHSFEIEEEDCPTGPVTHAHVNGLLGPSLNVLSLVVFISLSFHSVLEGLGIGSQSNKAWDIFIAIIAHKSLAAFALGSEFVSHKVQRTRYFFIIFLFSLMTPFGILIGAVLTNSSSSAEGPASGICTALAGGTFLFVTVMEIIPQELQNRERRWLKLVALVLGFVAFGVLAKWT